MAKLPFQPPVLRTQSLQINIDSEDDAKAVIQHLQEIKRNWDTMHAAGLVDSIEFCIQSAIRRKVEDTLQGAVRWCRTYIKQVAPFEGNVFYALPHFIPPSVQVTKTQASNESQAPVDATPPPPQKVNRYLRNLPPEQPACSLEQCETPGKSKRPVPADKPTG